jgi:hypothetical protein
MTPIKKTLYRLQLILRSIRFKISQETEDRIMQRFHKPLRSTINHRKNSNFSCCLIFKAQST